MTAAPETGIIDRGCSGVAVVDRLGVVLGRCQKYLIPKHGAQLAVLPAGIEEAGVLGGSRPDRC